MARANVPYAQPVHPIPSSSHGCLNLLYLQENGIRMSMAAVEDLEAG
jgi:hypothetical protein